jgi:hypothetical protein
MAAPALFPLGVLDLSLITDALIKYLNECLVNAPLWATLDGGLPTYTTKVSGSMPDAVRNPPSDDCELTISLLHVSQDKFQRNAAFVLDKTNRPDVRTSLRIPQHPLSLDLYYLLSAFAGKEYVREQQVMSIAMRCLHGHPIVSESFPLPGMAPVQVECTLTLESMTADEVARLWQAIAVPMRLSAMYKASVVFLTPPAPPPEVGPAAPVKSLSLAANPAALPFPDDRGVIGTRNRVEIVAFDGTVRNYDASPAVVPIGSTFLLEGVDIAKKIDGPQPTWDFLDVFLFSPPDDKNELNVSSWRKDVDQSTSSRFELTVPSGTAPGVYLIRAGKGLLADPTRYRTNATPFSIAARVDGPSPPNTPLLVAVSGTYTLIGEGFVAGSTEVIVDTIALTEAPALGAGAFIIDPNKTQITFQLPGSLAPNRNYTVRVRVNQVESPVSWWAKA